MSLVVLGANSGIALAVAQRFAKAGHALLLTGRTLERAAWAKTQLAPTVKADLLACDVLSVTTLEGVAQQMITWIQQQADEPFVFCAIGSIENQEEAKTNAGAALQVLDSNFRNLVALLTPLATALAASGKGTIIIVSSVAGDRGRQSNYVYGAAKAGLSAYAQGLRNRLYKHGVHVLTVKPGYVDTPMLRAALGDKFSDTPSLLIGQPAVVAEQIYRAAIRKKNVIYTTPIWRWIMLIIKTIPESIFKRMSL